jgi:zinc protease
MPVPASTLETAFWLESDRMLSLSFDPKVLEVQRKVVIEEFKQRYLDQPYGDLWLKMRPLAYKEHPYKWATIGKEISHIEDATMEDVKAFFAKHYRPNNAVLVVGGNVTEEQVLELANKYFGPIPAGDIQPKNIDKEPIQAEKRNLTIEAKVPVSLVFKGYKMCARNHPDYYATDLLSDILGRSQSSRLPKVLVEDKKLFSDAGAFVLGSSDEGMLMVNGYLSEGVSAESAEEAINEEIEKLLQNGITEEELEKVKAQAESSILFGKTEVLERCMSLAQAELLGDADLVNQESQAVQSVTTEDVMRIAKEILREENSNVIYYMAETPSSRKA